MMALWVSCLATVAVLAAPGRGYDWPERWRAGRSAPPSHTTHHGVWRSGLGRWCRWRLPGSRSAGPALADLVELLAAPLRAGSSTAAAARALAGAASSADAQRSLLDDLHASAQRGDPASAVWLRFAGATGSVEAAFVGRAWLLSEETGAPLADALECAGRVLRADAATRQRLQASSAGPRASMAVLCLLPLTGPAVGLVFGLSPVDLYFGTPLAAGSLALGMLLAAAGLLWSRALLRRALRAGRVTA